MSFTPPSTSGKAKLTLAALGAIALLVKKNEWKFVPQILKDNEPNYTRKAVVGTAIIIGFEKIVGNILKELNLNLPPSLGSMVSVFVLLKAVQATKGEKVAAELAEKFRPAVNFLGNWMPLFLTPPLVVLPNNLADVQGGRNWIRLAVVHFCSWFVSVGTTIGVSKAIQSALRTQNRRCSKSRLLKDTSPSKRTPGSAEDPAARRKRLFKAWRVVTAACAILLPTRFGNKPVLFSATVLSLLAGQSLPKSISKVIHPLVVASASTAIASVLLGRLNSVPGSAALKEYFRNAGLNSSLGPGDIFFSVLNASCCALGVRMFYTRKLLEANLPTLLGSTLFSSMLALFGTTYASKLIGLPPKCSLMLSQRSVMSSLGIGGANLLGASPALACASILVAGVYGASLGQDLFRSLGASEDETLTRGLVMGATSHSVGTASLMEKEPEAAAISSVALALAGIIHTSVCSVPAVQLTLKKIAGQA